MRCFLPCALLAFILCGCGILSKEPYRPVNFYDLGGKTVKASGIRMEIQDITSEKPYQEKMVFRISDNRIEVDEYNRWAARPSVIVSKYLSSAFEEGSTDQTTSLSLSADILELEAVMKEPSVKFAILVKMFSAKDGRCLFSKTYTRQVPVEKVTGENFAKGFEAALGGIADEIAKDAGTVRQ